MQYQIFGCKVNKYYLNLWLEHFEKKGFDKNNVLISTCVVTDRAKSKRVKQVKKYIDEGKKVYITGCGSIELGDLLDEKKFFDIYKELKKYDDKIVLLGQEPENEKFSNKENIYTKKFIVIQNGCDTHCSFCLTVLKRGKSYSIPTQDIVSQINDFEKDGGKEIVLTGINLAAYGATNTRLPKTTKINQLLKDILANTSVQRIRISSLGPEFLDDEFFGLMESQRFLPHFHFSIQSFNDEILKSMNRNYDSKTLDYVLTNIRNLKRKEIISVGADMIVGFPGETKEHFASTMDGVQKYGINKLHVFPFSPHRKYDKIPASDLPCQVMNSAIKQRVKTLIALGKDIRKEFIKKNIGTNQSVLIEEEKNGIRSGRTPNYIQVCLRGNYKNGDIADIVLDKDMLVC